MEIDYIDNIDELNIKYEYKINDILKSDDICLHLGFVCYDGMSFLLKKINQLIEKLKLYNGPKKDIAVQNLKEMTELFDIYKKLKKEVFDYNCYYIDLVRDIVVNYKKCTEIKNVKETTLKVIKGILDSNIEVYIKYDKKIINTLNKIKDLNFIFNF